MKVSNPVTSVSLGQVKGERPMHLICQALFNHYHVEAWGCPAGYDDTIATYGADRNPLDEGQVGAATNVRGRHAGWSQCRWHDLRW
jgi:hypothetical protein